jgi:hypothetical protein
MAREGQPIVTTCKFRARFQAPSYLSAVLSCQCACIRRMIVLERHETATYHCSQHGFIVLCDLQDSNFFEKLQSKFARRGSAVYGSLEWVHWSRIMAHEKSCPSSLSAHRASDQSTHRLLRYSVEVSRNMQQLVFIRLGKGTWFTWGVV